MISPTFDEKDGGIEMEEEGLNHSKSITFWKSLCF